MCAVSVSAQSRCVLTSASNVRVQEVGGALQQSDAEKAHLRDTLVRTEALIKQAKHEHGQDLQAAAAAARADLDALQRHAHDLQLTVRPGRLRAALHSIRPAPHIPHTRTAHRADCWAGIRWRVRLEKGVGRDGVDVQADSERSARERAEAAVQEAHSALEQHKGSLEQSHAQGVKAAAALQALKVRHPCTPRRPTPAGSAHGATAARRATAAQCSRRQRGSHTAVRRGTAPRAV